MSLPSDAASSPAAESPSLSRVTDDAAPSTEARLPNVSLASDAASSTEAGSPNVASHAAPSTQAGSPNVSLASDAALSAAAESHARSRVAAPAAPAEVQSRLSDPATSMAEAQSRVSAAAAPEGQSLESGVGAPPEAQSRASDAEPSAAPAEAQSPHASASVDASPSRSPPAGLNINRPLTVHASSGSSEGEPASNSTSALPNLRLSPRRTPARVGQAGAVPAHRQTPVAVSGPTTAEVLRLIDRPRRRWLVAASLALIAIVAFGNALLQEGPRTERRQQPRDPFEPPLVVADLRDEFVPFPVTGASPERAAPVRVKPMPLPAVRLEPRRERQPRPRAVPPAPVDPLEAWQ